LFIFLNFSKSHFLHFFRANDLLNSFKYANFTVDEQKDLAELAQLDESNSRLDGDNDSPRESKSPQSAKDEGEEDKDWAQIIPKEELERIKEEEKRLNDSQQVQIVLVYI
jgi:hypothetical protein